MGQIRKAIKKLKLGGITVEHFMFEGHDILGKRKLRKEILVQRACLGSDPLFVYRSWERCQISLIPLKKNEFMNRAKKIQ